MEITRTTADDWQRYRDVRLMALADAPYAFGATLASALARDEQAWRQTAGGPGVFIASVAGHDVGLAAVWVHPERFEEGMLTQMWTDPAARGHGVATQLVAAVVDRARELGITTLYLHYSDGNDRAASLYRTLGWTDTGRSEPMDADDPSRGLAHEMVRAL